MRLFGDYKGKEAPADTRPTKPATDCAANGCPLPGAYRMTNESSLCCVHDDEDAHRWPAQTERIGDRLRLWKLALLMSNAAPGETILQSTIERVVDDGGPNADGIKTQRAYSQAIRAFLVRDCKGELKVPVPLSPVKTLVAKLTQAA